MPSMKLRINEKLDKVSRIHQVIYGKFPRWHPSRQRLTFGPENKVLEAEQLISHYNLKDGENIILKDLGI
jgi:hypothetical protein